MGVMGDLLEVWNLQKFLQNISKQCNELLLELTGAFSAALRFQIIAI